MYHKCDTLLYSCLYIYGELVASITCRVDTKVHKPHPLYTKYSNTYSSLYIELYLGGVCTISCILPCTTLHALSPVNLQWSTLVDLDGRHHLHCSVNCHGLDSCSYAVCMHLRPRSQVKLLFVPPFQRLIILYEHAVWV